MGTTNKVLPLILIIQQLCLQYCTSFLFFKDSRNPKSALLCHDFNYSATVEELSYHEHYTCSTSLGQKRIAALMLKNKDWNLNRRQTTRFIIGT